LHVSTAAAAFTPGGTALTATPLHFASPAAHPLVAGNTGTASAPARSAALRSAASIARPSPLGASGGGAASGLASPLGSASSTSVLCSTGRACDAKTGLPLADVRRLRAARRLELVPIDHGLCLPAVTALDEVSCSWVHWKQAREPLSAASRRYVLSLDGRGDALMLSAVFGDRIKPSCLLTLRVCTALLQEGVKAGLTLSEVGLMMVRGSGVGVVEPSAAAAAAAAAPRPGAARPRRRRGGHGDSDDDDPSPSGGGAGGAAAPQLSALEQAVRKARKTVARARRAATGAHAARPSAAPAAAPRTQLQSQSGLLVSPLLAPSAPGGAAAGGGLPPRPSVASALHRGGPGPAGAPAAAGATSAAAAAAAAAGAGAESKRSWNVATKRRDRLARKSGAAAGSRRSSTHTAAGATPGGPAPHATPGRPPLGAGAAGALNGLSSVSPELRGSGGGGNGRAGHAQLRELDSPPMSPAGVPGLAGAGGAGGVADTTTLGFLPYHDAVVEAFVGALQPHIAAVLRRRSQLAAGSGMGIWGEAGGPSNK
jgi:hypothetical protein